MNLYYNKQYMEDIENIKSTNIPWERLKGKSIMVSGATGLIGSFFVDVILEKNKECNLECTVYALVILFNILPLDIHLKI